jgi:hypothetical protein
MCETASVGRRGGGRPLSDHGPPGAPARWGVPRAWVQQGISAAREAVQCDQVLRYAEIFERELQLREDLDDDTTRNPDRLYFAPNRQDI